MRVIYKIDYKSFNSVFSYNEAIMLNGEIVHYEDEIKSYLYLVSKSFKEEFSFSLQ